MRTLSGSLPPLGGSMGPASGPSIVLYNSLCFLLCTCMHEIDLLAGFTFVWFVGRLSWDLDPAD